MAMVAGKRPTAEPDGGASAKAPGGTLSPTPNRALPHWAILGMDEKRRQRGLPVVPVPDTDEGTFVQALQEMEATAEGPVGGSTEGDWEREGQPCDPRPIRRRAVHERHPGLLTDHRGGEQCGT